MPDKPNANLTLRGILQNGDNIDRSSSPVPSGGSGGGDAGGDTGAASSAPECGIGGCGTIY